MWIEAILSHEDLTTLVAQLLPLDLHLGDAGTDPDLHLSDLAKVELVENQGLRVECRAEIRWSVLGVDVPITVDSLALLLVPSIVKRSGRDALAFRVRLAELDLAWLPSALDATIRERVNRELKEKHLHLTWNFSETLSHVFRLPNAVRPIDALELEVAWGKVRVTNEALVMAVSFHGHVHRETETVDAPAAMVPLRAGRAARSASNGHGSAVRVPPGLALAGGAALASVAGYLVSRTTTGLYRYWRRRSRPARFFDRLPDYFRS
jgi:hypothetical protein